MRKKVCVLSFSTICSDARVLRQIKYLSPYYDLVVIGYGPPHPDWRDQPNVKWYTVPNLSPTSMPGRYLFRSFLLIGKGLPFIYDHLYYFEHPEYRQALDILLSNKCDLIHANEWEALPVAVEAAKRTGACVVYDAHEYSPLLREGIRRWLFLQAPMIRYILKKYIPHVNAMITVSPPIAQRYRQEYGLSPVVMMNVPEQVSVPEKDRAGSQLHLIHHGAAMRDRKLETMIEALALCDERYTLHFMLMEHGGPGYIEELRTLSSSLAPGRVVFHDPVPPEQIVQTISAFDIGIYILDSKLYNKRCALPNKFFDFISAGLAVCIGPSPAMVEIVEQYQFGRIAPSFDPHDMADTLNNLTIADVRKMQQKSREAAQYFNAQQEMRKLVHLYKALLS